MNLVKLPEMKAEEEKVKSSERKKRRSIVKLKKERWESIIPAREREREGGVGCLISDERAKTGCGIEFVPLRICFCIFILIPAHV